MDDLPRRRPSSGYSLRSVWKECGSEVRIRSKSHCEIRSMFSSASAGQSPSSPDAADVAAGVLLGVVEDPEVDAGVPEDAGERLRRPHVARVERGVVADEPEDLGRLLADVLDLERQLLRPAPALALRLAERVARVVDRLERRLELRRPSRRGLDEPPPQLVDDRHVLDADRADLDARHALHARPERLGPDRVAEDRRSRVVQRLARRAPRGCRAQPSAASRRSRTRSRGESG